MTTSSNLFLNHFRSILSRFPKSPFISARSADGLKPAPTIVIDLDETVLYRTRGLIDAITLYAAPNSSFADRVGEPYAGAYEALLHLSTRFRIVAVTARWGGRAGKPTERWLEKHGFRGLPLVLASGLHPQDKTRVGYKIAAVKLLQSEGWEPVVGIGDRPSDLEAYSATGLESVMVAHSQGASSESALHAVRDVFHAETQLSKSLQRKNVFYISDSHRVHETYASQNGLKHRPNIKSLPLNEIQPVWTQVRRLIDERASSLGGGYSSLENSDGKAANWEEEAVSPLDKLTLAKLSSSLKKDAAYQR